MSAPDFLDSNVLVYAYDMSDPRKQRLAQDLVRKAISGENVMSTQVLAEFAATLLHKLSPPVCSLFWMPWDILDALGPIRLSPMAISSIS